MFGVWCLGRIAPGFTDRLELKHERVCFFVFRVSQKNDSQPHTKHYTQKTKHPVITSSAGPLEATRPIFFGFQYYNRSRGQRAPNTKNQTRKTTSSFLSVSPFLPASAVALSWHFPGVRGSRPSFWACPSWLRVRPESCRYRSGIVW